VRRALILAALAAAAVTGVMSLADATQNRPDPFTPGGNQLLLSVRTRTGIDTHAAATTLWATCQHTVRRTRLVAMSHEGEGRYRLDLAPAVGEHGRRRLVGCLQDAVVERMVAAVEAFGPAPGPAPARGTR
jgi:hypothetical protein